MKGYEGRIGGGEGKRERGKEGRGKVGGKEGKEGKEEEGLTCRFLNSSF